MKRFLLILAIILWLPFNVQAIEEDAKLTEEQNVQIEKLYDYISNIQSEYEILNDMNPKEFVKNYIKNGESGLSIKELFKYFSTYAFREVLAAFKLVGSLIIVAIVCALLSNLQNAFSNENLTNIAYFACYSVMIILIVKGFYIGVNLAKDAILEMSDFIAALFPVLMMLLASVGGFVEATLMDPVIMGISSIGARFYATVLIPIICMSFVLEFVNNISDDYKVSNLSNLLRKSALWVQGIFMTVFIAIITIRSIAAKSLDLVTMKTAKFAVDSFIPVVGKTLSDAISTVAGYTVLLKNAISSVGLIVIIVIMMLPIIKILIMAFIYKLTAALIEPISDKKVVSIIDSAGNSLIMVNSCIISVSVMFFIMITIVASTGKGIIML
ncbi:MAG: stage III sporulation protein AE [Clostridium argentinense]|uniref:Stage III sporulation protein AE n=1 Tax=Clostridium faecium TaxID=2762223 RepID=A0ABR8YWR1_9CLOT|nr:MULTISPECIES: stage III sporulation protein AE [Clostridium]MBD8048386.1 stage III sporulation protein AE [Clostridium faecium]MBS5823225.1 stage III sporulation protein AE [Clostridium argentinense]MDU1349019.1 stage III sporulation protein AE [Clostridium argentinense]